MPNRFSILILLLAALATACSSRRGAGAVAGGLPRGGDGVLRRPVGDADDAGGAGAARSSIAWSRWSRRSRRDGPTSGCCCLRQQELDQGAQQLARAAALAPESAGDPAAAGARREPTRQSRRGDRATGGGRWSWIRAICEAAYALALDTERQGGPENDAEAQRVLEQLAGAAATTWRRGSSTCGSRRSAATRPRSTRALAPLTDASRAWSPEAQEQLKALLAAAADNPRAGGDARRVPEERAPARAGVPRGAGRGQHAARGSRPAADALPAAEEPGPAACAGRRRADVHDLTPMPDARPARRGSERSR